MCVCAQGAVCQCVLCVSVSVCAFMEEHGYAGMCGVCYMRVYVFVYM